MSSSTVELLVDYATRTAGALALLVLSWILAGWLQRRLKAYLTRTVDVTLATFLSSLARWGVLVLAVLSCLGIFGVDTTSFAAVLGGASLAVGLAFQGTLGNVAAGVMLLIFRPFRVGDAVTVDGCTGIVCEIGLFTTSLDTPAKRFVIPNGNVFGTKIERLSHHGDAMLVEVAVGVEYPADIDETKRVLERAISEIEGSLTDRPRVAVLTGLGASSVDYAVRVWCRPPDFFAVKERVTIASKKALDAAGIGIPYQTIDVNMVPQAAE